MQDINAIIAKSKTLGVAQVPVGGSSEHADAVLQIFKANPDKHFSGKMIKEIFAAAGVELKNPSNILHKLAKAKSLVRAKAGWYKLA